MARKCEAPLTQIAKDFALSVTTLKRWIAIADRNDAGAGPAVAVAESAEMRELKKRNRLLEQENEMTCTVLKYSKQGYYRWSPSRDGPGWSDAHLVNAALDIYADDPAFGYRFIADELPEKGVTAGDNRVQRLCRDHGIWSVFSEKNGD